MQILKSSLIFTLVLSFFSSSQAQLTSHYVQPIFFVPQDWSVSSSSVQAEAAAISSAMGEIDSFYEAQFGRDLKMTNLEVVQGNQLKEGYGIEWNGGNIYTDGIDLVGNVEHEVVSELFSRGYPTPPNQDNDIISMLFVKGAGARAIGRTFTGGDGGWGLVGDWAIDSIDGSVLEDEYWWSGRRKQMGAVAHELAHALDLPHPPPDESHTSIMGHWWNYPDLGLTEDEIDRVLGSNKVAFFTPEPSSSLLAVICGSLFLLKRSRK